MPIVYMHGVNTRNPNHFAPVKEYLRRIVAPTISPDPANVSITAADWFPLCDPPKWEGIARPTTFLGQGGEVERSELLDAILEKTPTVAALEPTFTSGQTNTPSQAARLDQLSDGDLADLITASFAGNDVDGMQRARIGVAADSLVRDRLVRERVRTAGDLEAQIEVLTAAVQAEVERHSPLAGQGAGDFLRGMRDRITESFSRVKDSPGAVLSIAAAELRPKLNEFVTRFLGDLLFYMTRRGSPKTPGSIPKVLIDSLALAQSNKEARGGEPLVLLTHSMGGQIAYDVLTSFLPSAQSSTVVDFWCATASQIGFFEELNMFLSSSSSFSKATGIRTPLVDAHLRHWWNVWDPNDILSFTTKGIFANGIDDEKYWSGRSIAAAHGGYLERPSFYRRFAEKVELALPVKD